MNAIIDGIVLLVKAVLDKADAELSPEESAAARRRLMEGISIREVTIKADEAGDLAAIPSSGNRQPPDTGSSGG